MTKARTTLRMLTLATAMLAWVCPAAAQPADDPPDPGAEDTPDDTQDDGAGAEALGDPDDATDGQGGAGSGGLEARLAELEQRDAARQQELDATRQRLDELERARAEEAIEETAEAVADAANTDPTLRPLASMFTRFEHREGYAMLGAGNPGCFPGANDGDCLRYRARLGLEVGNLRIADGVVGAVRFQPQAVGFWSPSGGLAHPNLELYEGSLVLALGDMVRLEVGRFPMVYGEHLVIGSLGWHPSARSFDGARLRLQPEENGWWIDFFWTMINEGGPGSFGDGDQYFYGVYAALGPLLGQGFALDVYGLARQENDRPDPFGGIMDWSLRVHLGGRFRYRIGLLDLRVETGMQIGRQGMSRPLDAELIIAGHFDGEVGLNFLDDHLRIWGVGFFASGDDPSTPELEGYDHLFPTAHKFLGLSDVIGPRNNIYGGSFGISGRPIDQLTLRADGFIFGRPQVTILADNYVGFEGDLQVIWNPGAGLTLRGLYAFFVPNAPTDAVHYIEVQFGYQLN